MNTQIINQVVNLVSLDKFVKSQEKQDVIQDALLALLEDSSLTVNKAVSQACNKSVNQFKFASKKFTSLDFKTKCGDFVVDLITGSAPNPMDTVLMEDFLHQSSKLFPKQFQLCGLVASGLTQEEIGKKLGITQQAVAKQLPIAQEVLKSFWNGATVANINMVYGLGG